MLQKAERSLERCLSVLQFLLAYMRSLSDPRTRWSRKCISSHLLPQLIFALVKLNLPCYRYIKGLLGGPTPAEYETLKQEKEDLQQQLDACKKKVEELQSQVCVQ